MTWLLLLILILPLITTAQHPIAHTSLSSAVPEDFRVGGRKHNRIRRYHIPAKMKISSPFVEESIHVDTRGRSKRIHPTLARSDVHSSKEKYEVYTTNYESRLQGLRRRAISSYTTTGRVGIPSMIRDPFEHMYAGGLPLLRTPLRRSFVEYLEFLAMCQQDWPCQDEVKRQFLMAVDYGRVDVVELFLKETKEIVKDVIPDAIRAAEKSKEAILSIESKQNEWQELSFSFSAVASASKDLDMVLLMLEAEKTA